jgi:hypothetical protein
MLAPVIFISLLHHRNGEERVWCARTLEGLFHRINIFSIIFLLGNFIPLTCGNLVFAKRKRFSSGLDPASVLQDFSMPLPVDWGRPPEVEGPSPYRVAPTTP